MRPRVFLFDVSGVLLQLRGGPASLLPNEEDPWALWLRSSAVRAFESGTSNEIEFVRALVKELSLDQDPEDVLKDFAAWPEKLHQNAVELIEALAALGYEVATLSNSNPVHWSHVSSKLRLGDYIQTHFLSHETGEVKPDRAAFERVIKYYKCCPSEIVFFDDNEQNVRAANDLGLEAYLVRGLDDVIAILRGRGWLQSNRPNAPSSGVKPE